MEAQQLDNPESFITKTGFKEAESKTIELFRLLLIWLVLYLILSSITKDENTIPTIDKITDKIKPGTIVHSALMEMDPQTRTRCIRSLDDMLSAPHKAAKKYTKAMRVGLLAGLTTEFIVNGNTAKPLSVVARTITYSLLVTFFAS